MTKEEAKQAYRDAWASFCLTQDPAVKEQLGRTMDMLQSKICRGPGPEWDAFAQTLPGFLQFWNRWGAEMEEKAQKLGRP